MSASNGTLAQRASIAIGTFYLLIGVAGLIVNPDFGIGASTSATQFLVDWNGWHAVLTLLLAAAASSCSWFSCAATDRLRRGRLSAEQPIVGGELEAA